MIPKLKRLVDRYTFKTSALPHSGLFQCSVRKCFISVLRTSPDFFFKWSVSLSNCNNSRFVLISQACGNSNLDRKVSYFSRTVYSLTTLRKPIMHTRFSIFSADRGRTVHQSVAEHGIHSPTSRLPRCNRPSSSCHFRDPLRIRLRMHSATTTIQIETH
jgi:hypothetical protein